MITEAILKINPNSEVVVRGNDINTCEIEWLNGTTPIPVADIEAKMTELQAEYDAEEWKRNRQAEYPSMDDCIHALLKRTATKTKYPKSGV